MTQEFHPCRQIFLEENYRSTGAILGAALAVVQQDKTRIQKTLIPTHPTGTSVVLAQTSTAPLEATYIARQIKHLIAHSGGMIDFGDIAVLLRYGALSRNIEMEFKKQGVPCRMVGGHKFFDRVEVKDILAYLQLVDNPAYTPALLRVINVPKRGLGDKTVKDLIEAAKRSKVSPFEMAVRTVNGSSMAGIGESARKRLKEFVLVVREGSRLVEAGIQVADLIDRIVQLSAYDIHLEKTYGAEYKERMENINELKAYATVVAEENGQGGIGKDEDAGDLTEEEDEAEFEEVVIPLSEEVDGKTPAKSKKKALGRTISREELEDDIEYSQEEVVMPPSSQPTEAGPEIPLRTFLAVSMLATDTDTEDAKQDAAQRKVTISTCHAAKGLEWPVVFVPACEEGVYPFYRSSEDKEIDEERRLLYVAITRAQVFCTLTHSATRMVGSDHKPKTLTPFLSGVSKQYPTLFKPQLQKFTAATRTEVARVLGKTSISEEECEIIIKDHLASRGTEPDYMATPPSSNGFGRSGSFGSYPNSQRYTGSAYSKNGAPASQGGSGWQPQGNRPVPPGGGGFTTARAMGGFSQPTRPSQPSQASQSASHSSSSSFTAPSSSAPAAPLPRATTPATAPFKPTTFTIPAAGTSRTISAGSLPTSSVSSTGAPGFGPTRWQKPTQSASSISSTGAKAFAPPRWTKPAQPASTSSENVTPAPMTSGKGSLTLPETRASRINDVVLLNPVVKPPGEGLLAGFQTAEKKALADMRDLGSPERGDSKRAAPSVDAIEEVSSSSPATQETGRGKRKKFKKSLD